MQKRFKDMDAYLLGLGRRYVQNLFFIYFNEALGVGIGPTEAISSQTA